MKRVCPAERSRARRTMGHFQSRDGPRAWQLGAVGRGLFRTDFRAPAIEFNNQEAVGALVLGLLAGFLVSSVNPFQYSISTPDNS